MRAMAFLCHYVRAYAVARLTASIDVDDEQSGEIMRERAMWPSASMRLLIVLGETGVF